MFNMAGINYSQDNILSTENAILFSGFTTKYFRQISLNRKRLRNALCQDGKYKFNVIDCSICDLNQIQKYIDNLDFF